MAASKKKLLYNSISSLTYQIVNVICAFILPRLILNTYGSDINGLVSSITQFLAVTSLLNLGVGAVVQTSLYKPLADRNFDKISAIMISAKRFFRKISYLVIIYVAVLCVVFPLFLNNQFDISYITVLILAIAVDSFMQYFISLSYSLLLSADQKGYIPSMIDTVLLITNTIVSVVLIKHSFSIQTVKLMTSFIYLMRPLALFIYVSKKYRINRNIHIEGEPIEQKWNGFAQHMATYVLYNTDIVVLTMFTSLETVSVYSVYNLVVEGIKKVITSLTGGLSAYFGSMIAKNEYESLKSSFADVEWLVHTGVTLIFTVCQILCVPFVLIYTNGIANEIYDVPLFATLLIVAQSSFSLSIPYNTLIQAAGHYRETQLSSYIEVLLNISISVLLVSKLGLVGVAIGTILAMSYKTIYLVFYLSKNILYYDTKNFFKHICVDVISMIFILLLFSTFHIIEYTYISWVMNAIKVFCLSFIVCFIINMIFYRSFMRKYFPFVKRHFK